MSLHSREFRAGVGFRHESALSEEQLTTERQRDRWVRILDAAVEAAGSGGYDQVHMRDVALRAGVSLATLYHYFPSKVHVLAWALERELRRFDGYLDDEPLGVTDPFDRLRALFTRLIDTMENSDRVTEALTHAYVASNVVASAEAEMIRIHTSDVFVERMIGSAATHLHRHVADLLTDVWTSEVLALVQGRRTYRAMRLRLATVIDLLDRANGDHSVRTARA